MRKPIINKHNDGILLLILFRHTRIIYYMYVYTYIRTYIYFLSKTPSKYAENRFSISFPSK